MNARDIVHSFGLFVKKSEQFGLSFSAKRSKQKNRPGALLLIAFLASSLLRLIDELGKVRQMEFQFPSNTSVRTRCYWLFHWSCS